MTRFRINKNREQKSEAHDKKPEQKEQKGNTQAESMSPAAERSMSVDRT